MSDLSSCELSRAQRHILRYRLAQDIPRLATNTGFDILASADETDTEGERAAAECNNLLHLVGLLDHIRASFRDEEDGRMPIATAFLPILGTYSHDRVLRATDDDERAAWTTISVRAQNASADGYDGIET